MISQKTLPFTNYNLPLVKSILPEYTGTYTLAHVIIKAFVLNYNWRLKRLGRFTAFFYTLCLSLYGVYFSN
jgi:hypothetical protein